MGWFVKATPRPLYSRECPGTRSKGSWARLQRRCGRVRKISPHRAYHSRTESLYQLRSPNPQLNNMYVCKESLLLTESGRTLHRPAVQEGSSCKLSVYETRKYTAWAKCESVSVSGAGSIANHCTSNAESSFSLKTANSGMMCLWRERRKVPDAAGGGERCLFATAQCCQSLLPS